MHTPAFFTNAAECGRPLNVVGEHITVLVGGSTTGSSEVFVQEGPEGSGPIPRTHPWDESFYVTRGEVDFSVDRCAMRTARVGDLVHVPAGTPHWFRWNRGGGAMLSITSGPAHRLTVEFREQSRSTFHSPEHLMARSIAAATQLLQVLKRWKEPSAP